MLIIVESPAKAKTISKIVGSKYVVKASIGHIRRLSDDKVGAGGDKLEVAGIDTLNHFKPLYEVDEDKKKVVTELKKLAKECKDGILFATDSDREGEAISWHLADVLGIKDKTTIKRLEFHEITDKAIKSAIASPRPLNLPLVYAQQARQVLDKLVGFKLSPVLWSTLSNYRLSAGRVQTPALRLVCQREDEIDAFISTEYWDIDGLFDQSQTTTTPKIAYQNEETAKEDKLDPTTLWRFTASNGAKLPKEVISKQMAEELTANAVANPVFNVISVKSANETSKTPAPFITSTLQQSASSFLGIAPGTTMRLAQKLYEGININGSPTALITYMRTDSTTLSADAIASSRQYIGQNYPNYLPASPKYYKSKSRNAQEAHEAIRPTNPLLTPDMVKSQLDGQLWRLYNLIWQRTLACQMTDEIKTRFSFELENKTKDAFAGSVAFTIHAGYKALTSNLKEAKNVEAGVVVGQKWNLQTLVLDQHFTKPPSRYNPASLIKKLEELGIGRPSTYASIISTLHDREYVEENTASLKPTALGRKVNQLLSENFTEVTSSDLTRDMEDNLDAISRGEKEYEQVLGDFWWQFKAEVEGKSKLILESRDKYKTLDEVASDPCPTCSGEMTLKLGRFGEYYQCLNTKEHMFPKNFKAYNLALVAAHRDFDEQAKGQMCAECGKQMIVRVSKSSLKAYIACADYKVGNKHTVTNITFGKCPKCIAEGRKGAKQGDLVLRSGKKGKFGKGGSGKDYIGCSLLAKDCGYVQRENNLEGAMDQVLDDISKETGKKPFSKSSKSNFKSATKKRTSVSK